MLKRRTETLTFLLFSIFWLWPPSGWTAYLCPKTMLTFDTLEKCQNFCLGVDCIPSGTYMCSADTDGNGENELYQCVRVSTCPLDPNVQCDENGQCSKYIQCNNKQIINGCLVTVSPMYGDTYTITTTPGSTVCVEVGEWGCSCEASVDMECRITSLNTPGDPWGGCGDLTVYSQAQYETVYECPLDGQTHSSQFECQSACVQTVACTISWECPVEGGTTCEDVSLSENYQDETPDLSYYQNDGEVDPDTGQCLGQILFFNGRPMTCRRSGLQTGFHNCCDADDEIVQKLDNQLSLLGGTLSVISKLKDAISIASEAIELYTTAANQAAALGATLDEAFLQDVALNLNTPVQIYNAVLDAVNAGGGATEGAVNALVNGLGLTPSGIVTTIALNFAMDFAMEILFGGCSEDDVITAAYNELGLCHYVGTKCVKKLPIVGCVQKAKVFCCFNSKLARIIQEQGRPQLKTIDSWGSTDFPNCRGLTPQEFQNLDFSRIDLHEWQQDIKTQSQDFIRENLQSNFNAFMKNLK